MDLYVLRTVVLFPLTMELILQNVNSSKFFVVLESQNVSWNS